MNTQLVRDIRQALADNANPIKAEGMRAYMKSEMPFRGVQKPARRKLVNETLRTYPLEDKAVWQNTVLELWRNPEYREERYIALDIAGAPQYLAFRNLDTLPMFEEMVATGAWWDYVDEVATHRLRELLERYPSDMARHMRSWSRDENMWKRRSSIICQINRKDETDLDLLFDCIDPNLSHPDFFIRKGHRLGLTVPGMDQPRRRRGLRGPEQRPHQQTLFPRSPQERRQDPRAHLRGCARDYVERENLSPH